MSENLNNLDFCIAEVIDVNPFNTYKYITGQDNNYYNLFAVQARIDGYVNRPIITAKPANNNIKKIPLLGEMILVFKLKSHIQTNHTYNQEQWYYISTVDINSSINHNVLTGYTSTQSEKQSTGKNFTEQVVSPLQPFEGDLLVEGRFGNSIRFSSTIRSLTEQIHTNSQDSVFTGDLVGDPIIVISNGRKNKPAKEFITEDIQADATSIWMTSTQRINKLKLNIKNKIGESENVFSHSQLIGKSNRIVLSSTLDTIILDGKTGIEINAPLIKMGKNTAKEPLLHSTAVVELLNIIVRTLQFGNVDAAGSMSKPINTEIMTKTTKLFNQILNRQILTDKYK